MDLLRKRDGITTTQQSTGDDFVAVDTILQDKLHQCIHMLAEFITLSATMMTCISFAYFRYAYNLYLFKCYVVGVEFRLRPCYVCRYIILPRSIFHNILLMFKSFISITDSSQTRLLRCHRINRMISAVCVNYQKTFIRYIYSKAKVIT